MIVKNARIYVSIYIRDYFQLLDTHDGDIREYLDEELDGQFVDEKRVGEILESICISITGAREVILGDPVTTSALPPEDEISRHEFYNRMEMVIRVGLDEDGYIEEIAPANMTMPEIKAGGNAYHIYNQMRGIYEVDLFENEVKK